MKDAALYAKSNTLQRVTSKKVFREYEPLLQWKKDGSDSILDIGCGTGDVTVDFILPSLPTNFRHLIGCDISDKMIDYAQKHYAGQPKVIFDKLDIGGSSVDEFLTEFGSFNLIVSFYCLHWVPDLTKAMQNIHKLLTPDGDCLLLFITSAAAFDVYVDMSKCSKWSQYMHDAEHHISPYYCTINPADDLRSLLQSVGFTSCDIRIQEENYLCKNKDEYISKLLCRSCT